MDLKVIIETIGYIGLFSVIFAESGLLIGFFLPGDSVLFTAGFLASQGIFDIRILVPLCFIAAVTGDSVGYAFGHRVGRRLFQREESLFFHPDHLQRAHAFYEKHGKKTIVLARFLPVVRTFAPIVAGIGDMEYRTFLSYNVIGGFLWAVCLPVAGFYLGSMIPDVDKYLIPIVVVIIILSILPQTYHVLSDPHLRGQLIALLKRPFTGSKKK
jgi:membrane-associated protein